MKYRIAAVIAVFALGAAAFAPSGVGAQDISINTGGVVFDDPGTIVPIASQAVPAELVGDTCTGTVTAGNNASTHPNNDLLITTGGQTYVIPDVEAGANDVSTTTGTAVLGDTIVVELRLGEDGASSGGLLLTIDCTDTPPDAGAEPPTPAEPDFTG